MKICRRCLYHEQHPLRLVLDEEGICSGCRVHEEKDELDWRDRAESLRRIFGEFRNKSGNNYDCIVPVSGAGDSFFIVHTVKNIFGMNPLLVTYNKQYNTAAGVRNLARLRQTFDCDIMTLTVSPERVKKITRATLRRFGSLYWHCLAGQTAYPVQTAARLKIPLIVWGAHQGIDQVGMFSHLDEVEMMRKYRKEHDLLCHEAQDLISDFDQIGEADLIQFNYPDDEEIEQIGIRGIYLNNYLRWDSRAQHEQMIELYGYETLRQTRTFDSYNHADCWNYSDVHDYLKLIKHGYGKALDHACREIRLRRMTREQGISLVKKYQYRKPKHLSLFLSWLGITENSFHYIADQHRNPRFWRRNAEWRWEPACDVLELAANAGADEARLTQAEKYSPFRLTAKGVSSDPQDRYILIGKGV